MKLIAEAILKAQKQMGNATKVSTNPFFKSKYADLNAIREACMPSLNENGISVLQPIVHVDGKNFVKTVLLHESGETFESMTEIIYSKQNDAQAQGSGITYARRYGLQSLLNIGAEDDDGNKASKPEPVKEANDYTDWITSVGNCKDLVSLAEYAEKNKDKRQDPKINAIFTKRKVELTNVK
tara:strand:+ start:86 stop:631 length:546 start_codon:yes stop_codon:yes gene_type:complete